VRQAKDALIALIYGAKFSGRAEDALPMIFNSTQLAKKIYLHPKFLALRDDIAGAREVVLKAQEVSRRTIKNCRGLTIRLDDSNERQQLAHLLQGVEVTALEAAYRLYPKEIVLLQHDGFTSTKPLDTKRIEAAMLEATGYRLEVKQKVIQVNLAKLLMPTRTTLIIKSKSAAKPMLARVPVIPLLVNTCHAFLPLPCLPAMPSCPATHRGSPPHDCSAGERVLDGH
jgi:hypothetical protein